MNKTNQKSNENSFDLDKALNPATALKDDRLKRAHFAERVVAALSPLSDESTIVVSVEGSWGSGKTSILSMVEQILRAESKPPVVIRFNPWLIGDRDALLRQFLSVLSKAIKLSDHSVTARKIAREIDGYSKIVGLAKFIPGLDSAATITKALLDAAGKAAHRIGDEKQHDLEEQKTRVATVLKDFETRVVVLVDDIDRLYPSEVFEVIRIIKAVADLPNIGYVLALDPVYASEALTKLGVPKASAYLDKVIQTRLSIPVLSSSAKLHLMSSGLNRLPEAALRTYFPDGNEQLLTAYHSGLKDLLDQPRDFARLYNVVQAIEPALRGEIVLADIISLAALSVKAFPVYELLRKVPAMFVGHMPNEVQFKKPEDVVKDYSDARLKACAECSIPNAVRRTLNFLFPLVAKAEGEVSLSASKRGRLSNPSRLAVALQLAVTEADVSLNQVNRFIDSEVGRAEVEGALTSQNCIEFLEVLGDAVTLREYGESEKLSEIALAIARLPDTVAFVERQKNRQIMEMPSWMLAIWVISNILRRQGDEECGNIAVAVASDEHALSVASNLVIGPDPKDKEKERFGVPDEKISHCRERFAENVLLSARSDSLFRHCSPGYILHAMAKCSPERCAELFSLIKNIDPKLDSFALSVLAGTYDSTKGQAYRLPNPSELTPFIGVEAFVRHARNRLKDKDLAYPIKAAWRSVVENKSLYGVDGSEARH